MIGDSDFAQILGLCDAFVRGGRAVIPLLPKEIELLEHGLDQRIAVHFSPRCPCCGTRLRVRPGPHGAVLCDLCCCQLQLLLCPRGCPGVALRAVARLGDQSCRVCGTRLAQGVETYGEL